MIAIYSGLLKGIGYFFSISPQKKTRTWLFFSQHHFFLLSSLGSCDPPIGGEGYPGIGVRDVTRGIEGALALAINLSPSGESG